MFFPFSGMCPVQKRSFRLLINKFRIFLPAPTLAALNNKLAGQPEWIKDGTGKITGYKTGGADTVFPFNSNYQINATFAGSKYGGSGYRSVIRHTFAIKVINGTISCSDLGRLFTEAVPEAGGNHAQDMYLQSLTVTKI